LGAELYFPHEPVAFVVSPALGFVVAFPVFRTPLGPQFSLALADHLAVSDPVTGAPVLLFASMRAKAMVAVLGHEGFGAHLVAAIHCRAFRSA
jgi:hypothetical protein